MDNMKTELQKAQQQLTKDLATQKYLQDKLEKENTNLQKQKVFNDDLLTVRALLQKAAQDTQQKLEYHINNLVSAALAAVFEEDPYEFKLEFVQKRGKTEADVWYVRNGNKTKPIDATGGGAVDVGDLAARIAFWSLTKRTRPIFFLDEPFRNLDEDRQEKALEMLKMLSTELGLQIIMVSHIKKLIAGADKEFNFKLKNGVTVIST